MTHTLKIWPGEFLAVCEGRKTHEVRRADRNFKVGDSLILKEWVPEGEDLSIGRFTDRAVLRKITYITPGGSWGLADDLCVLSIQP
jgi:hypothetical protein